jgi:hypothetical protein
VANDFSYLGTWNPSSAAYPVLPLTTNSGYFFVSEAGEFDGYQWSIGDWLVYTESPESDTSVNGRWFRLTGGIIQAIAITTDYGNINPGVYTKVTVNSHGIITSGSTLLSSDIPSHTQLSSTITDLTIAVNAVISSSFSNPQSKAVTLSYDSNTQKLSGDVKIDNSTIVKDQYGQLSVAGVPAIPDHNEVYPPEEHTHPSSEILNFSDDVKSTVGGMIANKQADAVKITYNSSTKTFSADVKIDGLTLQKDQYGQLEIAAIPATPNLSEQYPPTAHTHETSEIAGFTEGVRGEIGFGINRDPVFVNTPVSNAVVFRYDQNTLTISADIKLDNETITKNQYGQLVVLRPEGLVEDEEETIDTINRLVFSSGLDTLLTNFLEWIIV